MKKQIFSIMAITALLTASCKESGEQEAGIITRSDIKVENGLLSAEVMHSLAKVSDPQISPDGKKILYGIGFTSIGENKSNRELFVMNIDGTDNVQITKSAKSENNARWTPDGSSIAYILGGQIYIAGTDGSNPKKISEVENGVAEFEFSPDGKKILFISNIKSAKKPADIYPDLDKANARVADGLMYRHWDQFVEEIPHPFIAEISGTALENITDILEGEPFECPTLPFGGIDQLSWSPDGTKIAYSSRKKTGTEYALSTNTDIYLYDIASKKSVNISEGMMGYDTTPLFSPDGKSLAWISMEREGYEADKQRLFVMDMASGQKRELTKEFKYNVESITWMPDNSGIWFTSCVNALTGVYKVMLADNSVSQLTDGWYDFDGVKVAGDRLITTYKSMNMPNELVSINTADGKYTQISFENKHLLDQIKMGKVEQRWVTTTDNKKMHMWVIYPPDFDSTNKYPALLFCMGGPQGTLSQSWSYRWNPQLMAAHGYIVIYPNRRGTSAFGQEWCEQISGDYIGQNMKDYFTAVNEMKKESYVGKFGAVGASYGGYSVFYLAGTHKNVFSAFVAHAGIFNQEHMYMETEELWFPNFDNGGAPWDNNPVAKRHYENSPHKLVKNWNTPILITAGEMDFRVPYDQAMAAFTAAQLMKVPSKLVLFPEENHWILKPQNSIFWNRIYFEWLDKYLKN